MQLVDHECQARAQDARVARLATTGSDMRPHLVPVTFAAWGGELVIGIDQKPKSTANLRRLRNIWENPRVSLLWDRYDEDWTRLWWVRADGQAKVVDGGTTWAAAVEALRTKYPQYREDPPRGPAIIITIASWSGWSFSAG